MKFMEWNMEGNNMIDNEGFITTKCDKWETPKFLKKNNFIDFLSEMREYNKLKKGNGSKSKTNNNVSIQE